MNLQETKETQIVEGIRAVYEKNREEIENLEIRVRELKADNKKWESALWALRPDLRPDPQGGSKAAKPKKPLWRPSPDKFDPVMHAIQAADDGVTVQELDATFPDISRGTIEQVIRVGRKEGTIRLAGVNDNKANLYKAVS